MVWRLMVAITGVPGFIMLYWRCKMKETTAFSKAKTRRVSQWVLVKRSWRKLVGTAGCWFLFDITFYANGLFSSVIIEVRFPLASRAVLAAAVCDSVLGGRRTPGSLSAATTTSLSSLPPNSTLSWCSSPSLGTWVASSSSTESGGASCRWVCTCDSVCGVVFVSRGR